MAFNDTTATVFGGTGFIGRQVVRELARRGVTVKVATRVPAAAYFLRTNGLVGQIVPFYCDYADESSIARAVAGSDYVINCIGILSERRKGDFKRLQADLPGAIARACTVSRARRFVHISALGADKSNARYAQSKLAGEEEVRKNFPSATILRPSVVFGEDDNFFNKFASLARFVPFMPLIGGGATKFQPVYVGDVADAVMAALDPSRQDVKGQTYELGGPETVTLKEIYQGLFAYTHQRRKLMRLPWGLAKVQAFFLQMAPGAPLTVDQVEMLKTDNIVSPGAKGLAELSVKPTAMELVLPRYLSRFREGGRFAEIRAA